MHKCVVIKHVIDGGLGLACLSGVWGVCGGYAVWVRVLIGYTQLSPGRPEIATSDLDRTLPTEGVKPK